MPTVTTPNTGIEIFYEDRGSPDAEVILLVMGLGAQMTLWPDELVAALVGDGFRVIRYDNRDIGLSQKMEGARAPSPAVQVLRKKIGFPAITIDDNDTAYEDAGFYGSDWIIMTRDQALLKQPLLLDVTKEHVEFSARVLPWTDERSDLLRIMVSEEGSFLRWLQGL